MIIGIVGKPNVGKSAFFRSLTLADAESGNFPFTTIDANSAIGYVKVEDPAVPYGQHSMPRDGFVLGDWRFVPVEIIDVAGLVPGAHEGKGLGSKFLDDLRQADALIHVMDLSGATNDKGESVELNSYDPANDVRFLEEELDHWYFNIIKKHWDSIEKKVKLQDMKIEIALNSILSGLKINENMVLTALRELNLDKSNISENLFKFAQKLRQISKPMIIAANKCDVLLDNDLWKSKFERLKEQFPDYIIVPVMAEYEFNLKKAHKAEILKYIPGENFFEVTKEDSLSDAQKAGLNKIKDAITKLNGTGVQTCLNAAVFDLLKMKPIFPGSEKSIMGKTQFVIPDCFLMPEKTTALDFAYRLHTDFGKNFVQAIDIKRKIPVGKDHVLAFGDVIEIRSGK